MMTPLLALNAVTKMKLGLVLALVECRLVLTNAAFNHVRVFLGVAMHRAATSVPAPAGHLVRFCDEWGALCRVWVGHSVTPSH
jgi:hypothetical protein